MFDIEILANFVDGEKYDFQHFFQLYYYHSVFQHFCLFTFI